MKGYWHIVALSALMSALIIMLNTYVFFISYFSWIFYLFFTKRLRIFPLLLSLACFSFFLYYIPPISSSPPDNALLAEQSINGEIVSPPTFTDTNIHFTLETNDTDEAILIHYFPDESSQTYTDIFSSLKYGAQCHINGKVELPDTSRNPGQFDYQNHLLSQGIQYQLIIETTDDFYCEGSTKLDSIYSLRGKFIQTVSDSMSEETAAWLNALVLGDDSGLDEQIIDLFQRWSLSHILAISGLHVGLITALIYFLLVKLNIVTKETAQWIIIFFLPIYAFLAGGAPSVWRASLMGLAFLLLAKYRIRYSLTDVLSIVFISLIMIDPYIVYQIGFQFSFLVTFGIILSQYWLFQSPSRMWQVLKISFVAQLVITPLQLIYFSTFHPLSIILNSIVIPYFSFFVIPAMFLLFIFSPILPVFAKFFDLLFVQLQRIMVQFLEIVDQHFYFPWLIGDFPLIFVLLYYVCFVFMMLFLEKGSLKKAFYYGLSITLLFSALVLRPYFSNVGYVTMLDIGQGDTFVIELPYRKGVFLVDAGASFSFPNFEPSNRVYEQIIKPYLYSRGINEIDAIFLSHDHLDHDGSVPFLVEEMKVNEVIMSSYYEIDEAVEKVMSNHNVAIHRVQYNDEIALSGQKFHILAPNNDQYDENENSLVFQTSLGGESWLFTGDIGKEEERELIQNHDPLKIDVLKVAHHGSNTSTDESFLKQINPQYGLVSVGENNRYGHPDNEVIETLENEAVVILRTDHHGAIQFRFNKHEGTFYKFLP